MPGTNTKLMQRHFAGGEVSPEMLGHVDDVRVQNGARTLRNFITKPRGPAQRRPGTGFVREYRNNAGVSAKRARFLTFDYGRSQSVVLEIGFRHEYPVAPTWPGYIRFHALGGTLLFASDWNATTAYEVDQHVIFGGTLYRCTLAHTNQQPIGPPNSVYWQNRTYFVSQTFVDADVNVGTNTITLGSVHGLSTGDPLDLTTSGTLPDPLQLNTVYYAIRVSATELRFAATAALAAAGTAIDIISAAGGGTHRVHGHYDAMDMVGHLGAFFVCTFTRPITAGLNGTSIVPGTNEVYWYGLPSSREFEIPHGMAITEDELFALTYSQSMDVMRFATRAALPSELRRYGATRWTWTLTGFGTALASPTGVGITPTFGALLRVETSDATNDVLGFLQPHFLADGQVVYASGLSSSNVPDGFYIAQHRVGGAGNQTTEIQLREVATGDLRALNTQAGPLTGTLRLTDLNSDNVQWYQVAAINEYEQESLPSTAVSVTNNLFNNGASNLIAWAAVPGAVRYRVYKGRTQSGLFGWIGDTAELSFRDGSPSIAADFGRTPPILDGTLGGTLPQAPAAVGTYEGRTGWGGSDNEPQGIWLTVANTETDLSYAIPVKDSDRIHHRIKTRKLCRIRHLVPMSKMVVLTDSAEFLVSPVNTDAITPGSFAARAHTHVGAAEVQPVLLQNVLLFAAARGGHMHELGWVEQGDGFQAPDLSERAAHLFDGRTIVQLAAAQAPYPLAWAVSSTGELLGLTYMPSQGIAAWHRHDTDGVVETIAVASEGGEDRLWLGVRRTINGQTKRYVERMAKLGPTSQVEAFHVDCGLTTVTLTAATQLSGLGHLEGKLVQVLAAGEVQTSQRVTAGKIPLAEVVPAGTTVTVGLPFVSELEPVPFALSIEAFGSGRNKNSTSLSVRVQDSARFRVGSSSSALYPVTDIPAGELASGVMQVSIPGLWDRDGRVLIRMEDPLPLTVVSITPDIALGG